MKRNGLLFGAAVLALASAAPLSAQGGGWWEPAVMGATRGGERPSIGDVILGRGGRDARTTRRGDVDYRYEDRSNQGKKGNGPPFCRNGRGHPVHGWRWCEEKGWGRSSGANYGYGDWSQVDWRDVIFRRDPGRQQRMSSPTIAGVLGDVVFGRLAGHGRSRGLDGALEGRWLPLSGGGAVMQLRMGGVPLAELADLNRDGRADMILLSGR